MKFYSSEQLYDQMLGEKGLTVITGPGEKSEKFLCCGTKPNNLGKSLKLSVWASPENEVGR